MGIGELVNILFINPITNVLILFYNILLFLHVPYPLGFSIILLTIFIKLILWPFVTAQIKSAHKMQKVAPHIANLREKHKNDKKKQQEEMMKLYKEHGVNPAAGCLPIIIQLPIIWSLYTVLTHVVAASGNTAINKINEVLYSPAMRLDAKMWTTSFFGLSLADSPQKLFATHPYIALVPVVTGALQFILSKMMLPEEEVPRDKKKQDFASAMQTQSLFIFPIMIGFFSFSLPLGLSLYWNTFTIFGILQQHILVGPGALRPFIKKYREKYGRK